LLVFQHAGIPIAFKLNSPYNTGSITGNATGNATGVDGISKNGGRDGQKDFFYSRMVTLPFRKSKHFYSEIERKQITVQIDSLENQNAYPMQFWLPQFQFLSPSFFRFLTQDPIENAKTRKENAK
jgi:hypothetical protein